MIFKGFFHIFIFNTAIAESKEEKASKTGLDAGRASRSHGAQPVAWK